MSLQPGQIARAQVEDLVAYQSATDAAIALRALDSDLDTHIADTGNPHSVTAAQVGAIATSLKGAANGVAELDSNGLVPVAQLPPLAIGTTVVVADQTARYALTTSSVQNGDLVKQTDTLDVYMVIDQTQLNNSAGYVKISDMTAAPVDSVFGRIGAVVAVAGDYDSDQIDNASGVAGSTVSAALDQLASDIAAAVPTYNYLYGTPSGSVNGANQDFQMRNAANSANVNANPDETDLYLNNLWQEPGVQYTWFSAGVARFTTAPPTGSRVRVRGKEA